MLVTCAQQHNCDYVQCCHVFSHFFLYCFIWKPAESYRDTDGHTSYVTLSACTAMASYQLLYENYITAKRIESQEKFIWGLNYQCFFFFKSEVDNCTKLWQNNSNQTVLSSPYIACIKILFQTLSQRFFADSLKGINSDRWI